MRIKNWQLLLSFLIGSIIAYLGLLVIVDDRLFSFLKTFILIPRIVIGLAFFIAALQVLLVNRRIRPFWLEFEFASLCLFAAALWLATSPTQSTQTNFYSDTVSASFVLPADKIESDLANLHPHSNVILLLITDHEVQRYNVMLNDIQGVRSEDHNPPYNTDAVKVHVSLLRGLNGDTAVAFIKQLISVNAIYILPSASSPLLTPTSITNNPTFILPNKIESDLSILQSNHKIVILLMVDHQLHLYHALFIQIRDKSGNPVNPPFANEKADNVSIRLDQSTEDVIDDFINQLADATAIYLLPTQ